MGQKHESLLQTHHLLHSQAFPESRIFRRDTGLFYRANGSPISIGRKGMADSYAIIKVKEFLIHVEYEYKIGQDRQSKEQKDWQRMIESLGGIYQVIHDQKLTPLMAIEELKELLSARLHIK